MREFTETSLSMASRAAEEQSRISELKYPGFMTVAANYSSLRTVGNTVVDITTSNVRTL